MSHQDSTDQDLAPEDDAIIGVVFRRSLWVVAAVFVVAMVALFLGRDRVAATDPVDEQIAQAPTASVVVPQAPEARFTDITLEAGIDFLQVSGASGERLLPETMGGGVAFLDHDNDGDQDIALISGNHWDWSDGSERLSQTLALYQNDGSGHFRRVDAELGLHTDAYGMGLTVADYDADGHVDLFVTSVGKNQLFRNLGGQGFEDVTENVGVAGSEAGWSTGAVFVDYDGDGWLDLAVADYVSWSPEIDRNVDYRLVGVGRAYGPPTNFPGSQIRLFRNDAGARFLDVSESAGLTVTNRSTGAAVAKALAVMPVDLDGNGLVDLVVANDTTRNFAFINRGDGRFEEQGEALGVAFDNTGKATGAMGMDWAWPGGDDELVIAIGNFANEMTSIYATLPGQGVFSDDAVVKGIGPSSRKALTFGLFFFDYDLDGRSDLLQVNGHVENEINRVQPSQHYRQSAQLFWNCGRDCPRQFQAVEADRLGSLAEPRVGRGAAYGDVDGDGDLDVLIGQIDGAFALLRNDTKAGHWIRILLDDEGANRQGIGAMVTVKTDQGSQRRMVQTTRSYLSSMELPLTFGLGTATSASVTVTWPDGQVQEFGQQTAGEMVRLRRQAAGRSPAP